MEKAKITRYLKKDNLEIVDYIKTAEIKNNNQANKFKELLTELKLVEKKALEPIAETKAIKYGAYREVLKKEQELKGKMLVIKNLISDKLTEYSNSLMIESGEENAVVGRVITDAYVRKYKEIYIDVENIAEVPEEFLIVTLNLSEVKKAFKENHKQIKGLKIVEREVIK